MSEEKKSKFSGRINKFFRDYKSEFKKIVWPTFRFTAKQTGITIVVIAIIGVCIALLDTGFSKGFQLLSNLF